MNLKLAFVVFVAGLSLGVEREKSKCSYCPAAENKVCGILNEEYRNFKNFCYLECFKARFKNHGECGSGCRCSPEEAYICGSDGKTYKNSCYLLYQEIVVKHSGACDPINMSDYECENINKFNQ